MSLTSAMMTGFSGIKTNSVMVDTVGNNLANLNTTAFKGQRTLFETLFYETVSGGEAPSDTTGGTLPLQIGHGSGVAAVQRNFEQGGIDSTGFQSDLSIQGDGFFILSDTNGRQVFTRDGAFRLDASQTLVSSNGAPVQVFQVDATGTVDPAQLGDLVIPLGSASEAIATSQVVMEGRLDSSTNIASAGAVLQTNALVTSSGAPATQSTRLTDLVNVSGVPLFADGDVVTVNAAKGDIARPQSVFTVGATGNTLGDFSSFLEEVLGINTDPALGGSPGIRVADGPDPAAGTLIITSNNGEINAISLDASSIINTTGLVAAPFSFAETSPAVGEGVTTSFGVFDSLGNLSEVRLRMSLETKSENGTTWQFSAESVDDSDLSPLLGTGTITFDVNGQFVAATGTELSLDRADSGSATPLSFGLDFSRLTGLASPDGTSELIMIDQNGAPAGVLTGYSIDLDGIVTGSFSNQQTKVLGQVALATFINNEGLIAQAGNLFAPGVNSGDAVISAPRTSTAGAVISGSLEQSNVEIAREFINLITASTGITSASRVVRTADDLLQELLLIVR